MSRKSFGKGSPKRDASFHERRHERHMERLNNPAYMMSHNGVSYVNEEKKTRKLARLAAAEEKRLNKLRDQTQFGAW